MAIKSRSIKLFHRFGKRAMQRLALEEQELSVNGLTGERMTEGKLLLRFFHDQLRRDQLFHQRKQFRFIMVRDPLEEGKIEVLSSDGCQGHHLPRSIADLLK